MTRRTRRWGVLGLLATMTLSACQENNSAGSRVPTDAQANDVLKQYVVAARSAKTARDYCAISFLGEGCETDFGWAGGPAAIPSTTPSVVDSSRVVGDNIRVLVVCGTNGKGEPYQSDFPVERDSERGTLRAVMPVFWSGVGFSGKVSGDDPQQAGSTQGARTNTSC